MMYWVFELRFVRAGLRPPSQPDVESLLPSFETEPGGPSWLSAIDDVIESWLAAGQLDAVRAALERTDRAIAAARDPSSLGQGCALYLRSRLVAAEAAGRPQVEQLSRAALEHFRRSHARWWSAKALRVLAQGGFAGAGELHELRDIERRLRVSSGSP
jgi:hypothetical protein